MDKQYRSKFRMVRAQMLKKLFYLSLFSLALFLLLRPPLSLSLSLSLGVLQRRRRPPTSGCSCEYLIEFDWVCDDCGYGFVAVVIVGLLRVFGWIWLCLFWVVFWYCAMVVWWMCIVKWYAKIIKWFFNMLK